ncbi:polysaccharide biosynthesis tyrosine autokinase [Dysosmobacter sp.]|uniref:polysaccharide biosynthesis tyrosine autokinase n=1 Tax=Dysosmobacter sp. TaxID=2591382 RepID=UPI002A8C88ED|nr:polysaccharide biosynthesis tyrosine autokinase [Dysosmobacter sp.]MDY3281430.1 polysaccharide biosynthesis tyrosine autokinase [Dysosmobacter sp.]
MEERKIDVAEEEKIDLFRVLSEFLRAFRRLFWLPLILAAALGALSGLRSWRSYTPMYASEVTFTIQLTDSALTDLSGMTAYYDKATAEQLSKTFPYLVQSDVMQSKLRQELGVEWINGTITARAVNNTNLFSIRVTSSDPQAAYDILNGVIEVYPSVADYVIGSTRMNLLTEPSVAQQPYNSFNPKSAVIRGAALGAAAGLLLVLAYAFTRRSVREAEDVRQLLNQTCLAALPHVTMKKRSGGKQTLSILNGKLPGSFQESVRGMRLKFLREAEKHRARVVMVTSTLPGEGKTTAAVNLALTLSRSGYRVILMDLDLRKPSVKQTLGLNIPSRGVPEVLSAGEDAAGALVAVEGTELRLLAGDRASEDPRRQIVSHRLSTMVKELRGQADYVILDTPPCGLVADGASLARLADGIIYVLRTGTAQLSHVMDSLQLLSESGTPLLGCVVNGVAGSHSGYGYGYGGDYGKYSRKKREQETT